MWNKICYLLFFCVSGVVFSQNSSQQVTLNWKKDRFVFSDTKTFAVPYFVSNNFRLDPVQKKIFFEKQIPFDFFPSQVTVTVSALVLEPISISELGELDLSNIPDQIKVSFEPVAVRDKYYGIFSFSPILFANGVYNKVVSFSYNTETIKDFTNTLARKSTPINAELSSNVVLQGLQNSVLQLGSWRKLYVQKSGVYKISKSFLNELGFDTSVNPQNIKIYGNGGRMLPLRNDVAYPLDLQENAIQFVGESDGIFNDNDYILFYAEGVDTWNTDTHTFLNSYSDKSYYYITTSAGQGKRIVTATEPQDPVTATYITFNSFVYHEIDKINIAKTGRRWFGESFLIQNSQSFSFSFPNLVYSQPVAIQAVAATVSVGGSSIKLSANGQDLASINTSPIDDFSRARDVFLNGSIVSISNNIQVNISYNNNGVPSGNAFLDYIKLTATSYLKGYGKQFTFQVTEVATKVGTCEYQITNASRINQIWDITNIYNIQSIPNTALQSDIKFKANMGAPTRYVVLDDSDYYSPLKDTNAFVANQDLKGTIFLDSQGNFKDIDYLIITPTFLQSQAERLANFHRLNSNLNVKVVPLPLLYEEFSSGKQDIGAIRNFIRYVYNNASAIDKRVKYVCLFGDASYDFKDRIANNTNIVPVFYSKESFSTVSSYLSDDYYGLMNLNEGDMLGAKGLDIAVGRILASSTSQADAMVNKVIEYYQPESYGKWRNNIVFVADDVDVASDATLETKLDAIANQVATTKPFFNIKKIYLDAYVQATTSGGKKYPQAKEDLLNTIAQGALVVNYLGHGGEDVLTGESLFETYDAQNLKNKNKYPLFITVTCEFTQFDNPAHVTGGEYLYTNPSGGAIAVVATTRQIFKDVGEQFNDRLAYELFLETNNTYPTVAEAVRLTKSFNMDPNNNVISFIGDPALKIAIPKPKIILTQINDIPIASFTDTLKALGKVKFTGQVVNEFGNLLDYNGELYVNVYDKDIVLTTLGNDNTVVGTEVYKINFKTQGETIFRGNASLKNGKFEFSFVVPKDIKIPEGTGKVSFYAKNNQALEDHTGSDTTIKIGGVNLSATTDTTPPKIKLYFNDQYFVSGANTTESPILLAFLEDENGINTASGIGHDIVAYLDGNQTMPYVLNDFYETEKDDYTKGKLKFSFKNLSPGFHRLTFKAWDVYNNLAISELQFVVLNNESMTLSNVLNYPNPFVNYTEFWFSHNKPMEPLEVQVQIMTITGKIVCTKNQTITTTGLTSRDIIWDGRDDFGDLIGKGVYIYKLTVKSVITDKKAEKIEKLVIL